MKQAIELIQQQNYTEALKILNNLLKKDPKNGGILAEAGFCLSQIGEYAKSCTKFQLASKNKPDDPWIWQHYGYVLFQIGKISAAINAIQKAASIKPDDIMLLHQLAFLYHANNEDEQALKYADKVIILAQEEGNIRHLVESLSLKGMIYENIDPQKSLETYFLLRDLTENDPNSYDRISSLIIDKFKFSNNLNDLNVKDPDYNKATQLLRLGYIDEAVELYKKVINKDKYCYPAYLGIAQALYEKQFGTREIDDFDAPTGISELFKNYDQLNKEEKNIIHASIKPFESYIPKLSSLNSHFIIAPIDTKLTDYPANRYLKNKDYLENISFCSLRGIGGDNAYVGVERLRDFLWNAPQGKKFVSACVAHEFAHLVWCVLDEKITGKVQKLYNQARKDNSFLSNYSSSNVQEYFAEYYALYTKLLTSNLEIPNYEPMYKLIEELRTHHTN